MSLIHWWPLDGDLKDKITGQQLQNYNAYNTEEGKIGSAYSFDYDSMSYLSQPFTYTPPANKFSIALWFKWNSNSDAYWEDIFTIGQYYDTSWSSMPVVICIDTDGDLYVSIANGSESLGMSGPTYPLNMEEWYHIAATIDNQTVALYINGEKISEVSAQFSVDFSEYGNEFLIGGNGSEVGNYTINDVRFYDHVLSAAEIAELNKALVIHYTFEDTIAKNNTALLTNNTGLRNPTNVQDIYILDTNSHNGKYSCYFNGMTSCIDVPMINSAMFTNSYTLSFWTYSTSGSRRSIYFGDYYTSGDCMNLNFERTASGAFRYYHAGSPDKTFTTAIIGGGKWVLVTVVYDSIQHRLKVYINGQLKESYSHIATLTKPNGFMRIGRDEREGADQTPHQGYIDDFRFYANALSDREVKELYNCGGRISDHGDVTTGSFVEDAAAIQVNKNKTITLDETNEILFNEVNNASFKKDGTIVARQIIEI